MSGVEAAGFVLAALPLAISILEHYERTETTVRSFLRIKTEYRKCMRDLRYHNDRFEANLQLLLLQVAEDGKFEELLDDPGGPCWTDTELEEALRKRLLGRYESYLETIGELKKTVEKLHIAMGMNKVELQERVAGNFVS